MRRVVITGMGVLSPVGNSSGDFFRNLADGRSGIGRISDSFAERLNTRIAAQVDFDPETFFSKKIARTLDRVSQLALVAASQAWQDAGLHLPERDRRRAGVYLGTGMGGAHTLDASYRELYGTKARRLHPLTVVMAMNNAAASHISMTHGLQGPCLTFSTACSSSAVAIGEALRSIRHGYSDIMLAGGSESLLTYGVFMSWDSIGTLALEADDPARSCKPFSKDRSGFVLGEGAAFVVLESRERAIERGARIYAEIAGYGSTADADHITKPIVEGQAAAMEAALEDARLGAEAIGYINAHGTATIANDAVETQAIKRVFGMRAYAIPVSSTKSMHGHLLGAAGAVELVASVLALNHQTALPTMNLTEPDPDCDLDYVAGASRTVPLDAVMSNSFAFGGTNAVLIARRHE